MAMKMGLRQRSNFSVFVLYLFCGFLMGRSVKNMNPSKSPFVEAIEDKVRKKDKVAHNIRSLEFIPFYCNLFIFQMLVIILINEIHTEA